MTARPHVLMLADALEPEIHPDADAVGQRLHALRAGRRLEFTEVRGMAYAAADRDAPVQEFGPGVRIAAGPKGGDLEHLAHVAGPGLDTIDGLVAVLTRTQKKAA